MPRLNPLPKTRLPRRKHGEEPRAWATRMAKATGRAVLYERLPRTGGWVHLMVTPDGNDVRLRVPAY